MNYEQMLKILRKEDSLHIFDNSVFYPKVEKGKYALMESSVKCYVDERFSKDLIFFLKHMSCMHGINEAEQSLLNKKYKESLVADINLFCTTLEKAVDDLLFQMDKNTVVKQRTSMLDKILYFHNPDDSNNISLFHSQICYMFYERIEHIYGKIMEKGLFFDNSDTRQYKHLKDFFETSGLKDNKYVLKVTNMLSASSIQEKPLVIWSDSKRLKVLVDQAFYGPIKFPGVVIRSPSLSKKYKRLFSKP